MAEKEVKLMKGNEVIAHAAIRYGCDGYFGYPITPQSEVMETLMELKPWETTGMVVLQAESEISSINMVYGGASTGKRVMTSSSSPGISLMSEGLSYLAGAELPCLVINCQRGGPGLGTIQPSQGDYFQACKGGGHGDFHMIVLAPNSVQEMHDHVAEAFDLAFKYRNPAMILADGAIGQMMEKVVLAPQRPRKTDEEIAAECRSWATYGKPADRKRNIVTSLELQSEKMEIINKRLQEKYKALEENEVRYEEIGCDDADYVIVAFVGPYLLGHGRDGARRRAEGRPAASDHALSFPQEAAGRTGRARCQRLPFRRAQCRPDGRGRAAGRERRSSRRAFRPSGRYDVRARRSARGAQGKTD